MGYSILLGAISSYVTEGIKYLRSRIGKKNTKNLIHLILFGFALIFTGLTTSGILSLETVERLVSFLGAALANYEIVWKRLKPFIKDKILSTTSKRLR